METATIIFKDGTEIEAEVNGNTLITAEEPEFPEDLSVVTVRGENFEWVYQYAEVVRASGADNRYWFVFAEVPESVREIQQLRADNDMLIECILEMSEIIYAE